MAAVGAVVAELNAKGLKDMGRVMGALKRALHGVDGLRPRRAAC